MLSSLQNHIYFDSLFNNAKQNAILLIDTDGTITAINPAFTNNFGYTEHDIVNRNISVLFTEQDQKRDLPGRELLTVLETGQSSDNNYLVHKNNTITWVSGESVLVKNSEQKTSIVKVIQNIHEQKVLENDLVLLNDFNENILGSIENVIVILNQKLEVVKTNQAFNNFFNADKQLNEAFNFADFLRLWDVNVHLLNSIRQTIATKNSFLNQQIEITTVSGDQRFFDVSCSPIQNNRDDNVLLIMHDITMFKQVEKEREDILGFIAHELRNPLTNLVLCNEIMSEAIKINKMDDIKDMLQRSNNNVMRLRKMIAELYDTTKVSSGNLQLEIDSFNLGDMIDEAIETIMVLQPAYNIIVEGEMNIQVQGDKYRLIQVVTNYLSNGIKYSDGKTDVFLVVRHDEKSLTVAVKDEGLGISKEQVPYIFDRFFRGEKTRNIEGIGLGLYLCRRIIHAHKGQVWVESEEGKGSTFYFSIPIHT